MPRNPDLATRHFDFEVPVTVYEQWWVPAPTERHPKAKQEHRRVIGTGRIIRHTSRSVAVLLDDDPMPVWFHFVHSAVPWVMNGNPDRFIPTTREFPAL